MTDFVPPFAKELAGFVDAAGGKTYAVGGAVRDHFLGKPAKDMDLLCTGIPYPTLAQVFGRFQCDLVGEFQVLKVREPNSDNVIDVAIPRTEKQNGQGHNDFAVVGDHTLPVEADLSRRDLTCNAVAVNVLTGEVIDPFGGVQDIKDRVIRAVGRAEDRFSEDPLRMVRAMRFVAKCDFYFAPATLTAITDMSGEIGRVAGERLQTELMGLLSCPNPKAVRAALGLMRDTGLLSAIIPEFQPSIGMVQDNPYHNRTVDEHVFAAVKYAVDRGFSPRTRLAVLLHDIGKPATRSVVDGMAHYYGHEDVSADMVVGVMERLKFPTSETEAVSKIVREHLRPANNEDKTLRRYMAAMASLTSEAVDAREADLGAHAPHVAATARVVCDDYRARIATTPVSVKGFTAGDLALKGGVLMSPPYSLKGKEIGNAKAMLAAAVIDGLVPNEEAALLEFFKGKAG